MEFYKYHGTGNDFILIDGFKYTEYQNGIDEIKVYDMCHRRFGIGADGLIILAPCETLDFKMIYYNSDGRESSMCGNGGRCLVKFAYDLNYIGRNVVFEAIDGIHDGIVEEDSTVSLKMINVTSTESIGDDLLLNTGSPHYIRRLDNLEDLQIVEAAHAIRYSDRFKSDGVNVNFIKEEEGFIKVRTYERGVEDETLSCGTGVVAASIAYQIFNNRKDSEVSVVALGGELKVRFEKKDTSYNNIWLQGPAKYVFKGKWPD